MTYSRAWDELFSSVEKCLHVTLRFAGQERFPEYADAEIDRFRKRKLFPLSQKRLLADLTGLFWTKLCEKLSLERNFGYAEEEVQRGADRGAAPSD